jgi:hypothetical protein
MFSMLSVAGFVEGFQPHLPDLACAELISAGMPIPWSCGESEHPVRVTSEKGKTSRDETVSVSPPLQEARPRR